MKQVVYIIIIALIAGACRFNEKDWSDLRKELTRVKHYEQLHRTTMDSLGRTEGWQSKKIEILWAKQKVLDSLNLESVDRIINKYGFPTKEKVGELTETVFLVLQHSKDMANYYELIVGAGKKGDLQMRDVAPYQDRVLLSRRVPQEFGTQVWIDYKVDAKTGEQYDSLYLWEVRDPKNVNARRLAAGLDSLETSLRRFNINPETGYVIRRSNPGRIGK